MFLVVEGDDCDCFGVCDVFVDDFVVVVVYLVGVYVLDVFFVDEVVL